MLTFAIGIVTQQWNLAIVGIVYSWITAAAMWENLRARLPYLYDPRSESLPAPPTLMHAMVAISILIECASIITALVLAIGGRDSLAVAQSLGYALCAVAVSIGVANFLAGRDVSPAQVWCWRDAPPEQDRAEPWIKRYLAADRRDLSWLLCGVGAGVLLGLLAHFYLLAIVSIPSIGEAIRTSRQQMENIPGMLAAYAVIAIGFAPFAEEYLFRGLVFRALDREWGGWKAVAGAAAFFAIYHPPLAWLPVALVAQPTVSSSRRPAGLPRRSCCTCRIMSWSSCGPEDTELLLAMLSAGAVSHSAAFSVSDALSTTSSMWVIFSRPFSTAKASFPSTSSSASRPKIS
jgi:membrane protease YdiL (CAAX protease family)